MKPGFGTGGGVSFSGIDPRVYMAAQERDMAAVGDFARVLGGTIGGGLKGGLKGAVEGGREQVDEEYKRLKDGARAADYFMKAAGEEGFQSAGVSKDEWDTMGAREKLAAVKGIMQAQTMREMADAFQAHAQERELRKQQADIQARRFMAEQEGLSRQQKFNEDIARQMAPIPGTNGVPAFDMTASPQTKAIMGPQRLRPEDFMRTAAKAGVLDPQMVAKFMEDGQPFNWNDVMPREFTTTTGERGMVGKSGQFQFIPQPWMDENGLRRMPVKDESGDVTGWRIRTGKNSTVAEPKEKDARLLGESFFTRLYTLQDALQNAKRVKTSILGKELSEEQKAKEVERSKVETAEALRNLRNHLEVHRKQGVGTKELWNDLYEQNGLELPGSTDKTRTATDVARTDTAKAGKKLTPALAQEFLAKAGGNKSKARELAREAGYTF
jgi:hypothetical protein